MKKRSIVGKDFIEVSNMSLGQSVVGAVESSGMVGGISVLGAVPHILSISQKEGQYEHYIHPGSAK